MRSGNFGQKYVYLGEYPQTLVENEDLIKILKRITTTNEKGYIEYEGGQYKKVIASTYESNYKKYVNGEFVDAKDIYCFKNGEQVIDGNTYFFAVNSIKWRVLEEKDGTYKLISENILDNIPFNTVLVEREIDDEKINPNNYYYSSIRAWLNGYDGTSYQVKDYTNNGFYDIVFSKGEMKKIKKNSESRNDKVGLLSIEDVVNSLYGFDETSDRQAEVSDYAICSGCMISIEDSSYGNGSWWLSSPDIYSYVGPTGNGYGAFVFHNIEHVVCTDGSITGTAGFSSKYSPNVGEKGYGIRPSITIIID